jgi:hypothetical protein
MKEKVIREQRKWRGIDPRCRLHSLGSDINAGAVGFVICCGGLTKAVADSVQRSQKPKLMAVNSDRSFYTVRMLLLGQEE